MTEKEGRKDTASEDLGRTQGRRKEGRKSTEIYRRSAPAAGLHSKSGLKREREVGAWVLGWTKYLKIEGM